MSLRRNFGWVLASNLVAAASQFVLVVSVSKLGGTLALGLYTLAQSIAVPAQAFGSLQFRPILATDARDRFAFHSAWTLRLILSWAAFLLVSVFGLGAWGFTEKALVLIFFAARSMVEFWGDLAYGFFQKHERMDLSSRSTMLKALLGLGLFTGLLGASGSLVAALAATVLTQLSAFLLYDRPWVVRLCAGAPTEARRPFRLGVDRAAAIALLRLGVPLGLVTFLNSLQVNVPKYFLEASAGTAFVGIFSALVYFRVGGELFMNAMGQAMAPGLARCHVQRDRWALSLRVAGLAGFGVALGLAGWLVSLFWGAPLLRLVFNPEVAGHAEAFRWVMLGNLLFYAASAFGYAATAMRKVRAQLAASLVTAGVLVACCVLLVPGRGVLGAAYAVVITGAVSLLAKGLALATRPDQA